MSSGNLTTDIPSYLPHELVTALATGQGVRIERIVSRGHVSPPDFWYDQAEHELVVLVDGEARLQVQGQRERTLRRGDWLVIGSHVRHRVTWTDPRRDTIWLAVFYRGRDER
jgi:cupin 2 domain-containing protein